MKKSTNNLTSALRGAIKKLFFCSQLFIISLSLPSLFYVGISYNTEIPQQKHLILTNKGTRFLATGNEEGTEKISKYSPAFLQL